MADKHGTRLSGILVLPFSVSSKFQVAQCKPECESVCIKVKTVLPTRLQMMATSTKSHHFMQCINPVNLSSML